MPVVDHQAAPLWPACGVSGKPQTRAHIQPCLLSSFGFVHLVEEQKSCVPEVLPYTISKPVGDDLIFQLDVHESFFFVDLHGVFHLDDEGSDVLGKHLFKHQNSQTRLWIVYVC